MSLTASLLWVLSGCLLGVSFIMPYLWWLTLPGIVCLLYCIERTTSCWQVFLFSLLVGTLRYGGSLLWGFNTLPPEWIAVNQPLLQFVCVLIYWIITSTVLGLTVGVFGLIVKKSRMRKWLLLFLVPILWVVSEILASFIFSIYSLGAGNSINIDFSFGYVGYLLAQNQFLVGLSAILGVYGLSYFALLFATTIFICLDTKKYRTRKTLSIILIFLLCVTFLSSLSAQKNNKTGEKVIAIETYFDKQFDTKENKNEVRKIALLGAMEYALYNNPDVIILPEDSRFSELFASQDELTVWAKEKNKDFDGIIVDSGRTIDSSTQNVVIRASLYDLTDNSVAKFDKKYLVPHGEYLPYLQKRVLNLFLSSETVTKVERSLQYKQGILTDSPKFSKNLPAVLFCFESVSPLGVHRAIQARHPSFVAHVVSHAWFDKPYAFWYQLDSMLQVQAVWNNIPIISAGNMSPSKLYLPTGKIERGEPLEQGVYWKLQAYTL